MKKRILFVCETVTLAHIMRPLELACALDRDHYDVHLAAGEFPKFLEPQLRQLTLWPLFSAVPSKVFLQALAKGRLPYDVDRVEQQVQEDLVLLRNILPDVVVGDFRFSLGVSARALGIPYINLTNITWHPTAAIPHQAPDHPIARLFGERAAAQLFHWIRPRLYRSFAEPFNQAARSLHLQEFGSLSALHISGDYAFYADLPTLVRTAALPARHRLGGPVMPSIQTQLTQPLPGAGDPRPIIVVSMGSSGYQHMVPKIAEALSRLPVLAYIATAGGAIEGQSYENVIVASYLPLETLFERASLVICNGGSPTGYLALSKGVPFLAIPANLDQFNFSAAVIQRGAARRLRPEHVTSATILREVEEMLKDAQTKKCAMDLKAEIAAIPTSQVFQKLIDEITNRTARSPRAIDRSVGG
ncbi:MAG: hypothetical protein NDI61_02520 [Bdellovibrionaceae bacterium]|nr:hypothetical protein [Pseudobdellovibrionaceae bacterium]